MRPPKEFEGHHENDDETFGHRKARRSLRRALNDKSTIVRTYAVSSLGSFHDESDVTVIRTRLLKEKRAEVRVALLCALHSLGEEGELLRALEFLGHPQYRVRCTTANLIATLELSKPLKAAVMEKLQQALSVERTVAGASSIKGAFRSQRRRRTVRQ